MKVIGRQAPDESSLAVVPTTCLASMSERASRAALSSTSERPWSRLVGRAAAVAAMAAIMVVTFISLVVVVRG